MIILDFDDLRVRRLDPMNIGIQRGEWREGDCPAPTAKNPHLYSPSTRPEGGYYRWTTTSYHSSIKQALRALPDALLAHPDVKHIGEFFQRWEKALNSL